MKNAITVFINMLVDCLQDPRNAEKEEALTQYWEQIITTFRLKIGQEVSFPRNIANINLAEHLQRLKIPTYYSDIYAYYLALACYSGNFLALKIRWRFRNTTCLLIDVSNDNFNLGADFETEIRKHLPAINWLPDQTVQTSRVFLVILHRSDLRTECFFLGRGCKLVHI